MNPSLNMLLYRQYNPSPPTKTYSRITLTAIKSALFFTTAGRETNTWGIRNEEKFKYPLEGINTQNWVVKCAI